MFKILDEESLRAGPPRDYLCTGISDLLRRDYWHRIWVIQEISRARQVLVVCGEKSERLGALDATLTAI